MDKPYLKVVFSDGKCFGIPGKIIAEHRARALLMEDPNLSFDLAVRELLGDKEQDIDPDTFAIEKHAHCDMEWSDLKEHAVELEDAEGPNYENEWACANSEVIT